MSNFEVIVVGAGLAGATAALNLSRAGASVLILEARDRAGGRGYTREFAGTADQLDYGGAWITPWQHRIRKLCSELGIGLRPRHPVTQRRWFYDGSLHHDGPAPQRQRNAHAEALARIADDSRLLKAGQDFGQETLAQYLDRIAAPSATRELVSAWWTVSGNGDKTRVPASEFLHSAAHHDGTPDGICEVWAETLVGGVQTLCERMVAASGAAIRYAATVQTIHHRGSSASLVLAGGETMHARSIIIATGLNPMAHIAFDPSLPKPKTHSLSFGHLGRAVKIWAKLEGVPVGVLATGGGHAIEWMFTERLAADGATLAVGFGVQGHNWTPSFPRNAEQAAAHFFPEARFIACDWHDWNTDPFSRGAWVASIAGHPEAHRAETWNAHGDLAFASSDFAATDAGWFEAAIISGADAAGATVARLGIALAPQV